MKLERFIVTFVMMNIVLMIAIVFSVKDFTVMEALSEIIYGQKTAPAHYALSPSKLKEEGFKSDNKEVFQNGMSEIYATTIISAEKIAKLNNLPPYEKGVEIVRMFSLMGDGECLSEPNIADKINQTAKKNGCSVDFAQIFTILAKASGLDARIVSNGIHYGAEIYNGNKWIYIDPYFAMSASGKEGRMSYIEFSNAILNNGWIIFDYFGGENHCMNGKPIAEHPYFSDQELFASIYSLNGNNIFEVNKIESKYS
ncbi:MAG: hypothetical protein C0603_05110 [Denitrovibrio sp.]|nr:MAG: hypothetical protein C0603_05110 [Denitrovibrio sp.]